MHGIDLNRIKHFVSGACDDPSDLKQTFALVKCTEINAASETDRMGTIITNNFILTASVLPADDVMCVITYNINGKQPEQTTKSFSIRSYVVESNISPHLTPQLQLLELNTPINFELPGPIPDIILAKTMDLAKRRPKIRESAILHTIRKTGDKYDVVQMEVKFASRKDCEDENPNMHPHVFCITIDGCDGCKDVMPGAALVQKDDEIDGLIGIVSERVACDSSKKLLCANVYEVRKWIQTNVKVGGFWPWLSAGNAKLLNGWLFFSYNLVEISMECDPDKEFPFIQRVHISSEEKL
uniref:Peptidase S1 domain-containing protein n=1 Tax=Glossina pallidipes TaxID=7398 RepID=A0A1A9ZNW0_GLOPL